MERVTFLVERTGERIPCLLNPEGLEVRRSAGIARRKGIGGALLGNPRTDDPLVATGGGITEYELKLLFDVDLLAGQSDAAIPPPTEEVADTVPAGLEEEPATEGGETPSEPEIATDVADEPTVAVPSPPPTVDVRSLTQPLWALAENGEPVAGSLAPQRVRFVWGRSWNVPCVVLAVAERLEEFDSQGVPKRSWLSMLLRRVEEQLESGAAPAPPTSPQFEVNESGTSEDAGDDSLTIPVDEDGTALTPLYLVAAERYGDPHYDRAIAEYNNLDDLLEIEEGQAIRLPPASAVASVG